MESVDLPRLKQECCDLLRKNPYAIFNTKGIKSLNANWEHFFTEIDHKAKQLDGAMILTEVKKTLVEKFEKLGFMEVPTDDEAIDFIETQKLESQFLLEDDDDDDF